MIIAVDLRCLNKEISNGISVYTYNLLKQLLRVDKDNFYKIFLNRQDLLPLFKDFSRENLQIYNFNIPTKILNATLKFFKKPKIDKLLGGADIFWLPNLNFLALSNDCQLVTTVHDISFKEMPEFYSRKSRFWHKLINLQKILERSHLIITVSENSKNDLLRHYFLDENKIKVIYPGADHLAKNNKEKLDNFKKKYLLSDNYFLCLATFEPRKNLESVILAFTKLLDSHPALLKENWQLAIAGGKGWLSKSIFQIFKKVKNQQQIIIINNIEKEDLTRLYQSAKIFVWPSYYEGFGFPPPEALNYNLPIITSFHSSLVEVLNDAAVFINPFNCQEIYLAMKTLIERTFLPERKEEILQRFIWENSARKLLAEFNSLKNNYENWH